MGGHHWVKSDQNILYFLAARFLAGALVGGGAVVLVTRPDLVLPRILGCSTIAGACTDLVSQR